MRILVGYKSTNEETKAYRIVKYEDGVFSAHTFMVMTRPWNGTKYLAGGNTVKIKGLTHIEEIELEGVEE